MNVRLITRSQRIPRPQMTDDAGRTTTREHPEHVLLSKLEECESLRSILEFCIWVLNELGYRDLAKAATKRLKEAIDESS